MPEFDFGPVPFTYESGDGRADAFMAGLDPARFTNFFNMTTHREACRRGPDVWDLCASRLKGLQRELMDDGTMFMLSGTLMFPMNKSIDASSFYLVSRLLRY